MRKVVITLLLVAVLSLALAGPALAVPPPHANSNPGFGYDEYITGDRPWQSRHGLGNEYRR